MQLAAFARTVLSRLSTSGTQFMYAGSKVLMANHSTNIPTYNKEVTVEEVESMRINYTVGSIDRENLPSKDPIKLFTLWFNEACQNPKIVEANSMSLATANKQGIPSCRIVLLKGFNEDGFRFFTNHQSQKGKELEENPHAALVFYWEPLQKQVRITGSVAQLSEQDSSNYFHSRPTSSQIGALVSNQSTVIPDKKFLENRKKELEEKYADKIIPKPDYWGGYLVKPSTIEFWCGGSGRLHSRVRFRRRLENEEIDSTLTKEGDAGWLYELLSP